MNKDVIYIDAEDDITAIIGRIKASKEKIVALVPPKGLGVFQSIVNMRLLAKISDESKKRIVIISGDANIGSLAAVAGIPVAKNLQTKPEVAETPILKIDKGEDIIDGNELSIGDLAKTVASDTDARKEVAIAEVALNQSNIGHESANSFTRRTSKTSKVPNFGRFRKKLIFIGLGLLVLVGFLVWAIWFAPKATINIVAKTTNIAISERINLKSDVATNADTKTLRVTKQEQKADVTVEFKATGEKNAGEKAKGSIRLLAGYTGDIGSTIPAGTQVQSASGAKFSTDKSVTFTLENWTGLEVGVTAVSPGVSSNGAKGNVSGLPSQISGSFVDATAGGTDKMITVVSQEDIDKATDELSGKKADDLRSKLNSSFSNSAIAVEASFREERSEPSPSVKLGDEATGNVILKATITGTMLAVDRTDIDSFLTSIAKKEIGDKKSQKVYKNGADNAKFSQFRENGEAPSVILSAEIVTGPAIDEAEVKEQAKGLRYGDIQSKLETIEGVDSVDTQFSPLWVRTAPDDISRIEVKFDIQNASP